MVKKGLPEPLANVGGAGCALKVHGGKLGEGILIQVIVVVFRKLLLHLDFVNVYLLNDDSSPVRDLTTDTEIQRLTLAGLHKMQKF